MCLPGTTQTLHAHATDHGHPRFSRRAALVAGAGTAAGLLWPRAAAAQPALPAHAGRGSPGRRLADLTHPFTRDFPTYAEERARRRPLVTIPDDGYYAQEWTFAEHTATHIDAPGHFVPGGRLSPDLDPAELLLPAAVVDISARVPDDPDAEVTVDDVRAYERRHGRIPRGAAVFMYSGWETRLRAEDPEAAYRGTDLIADGRYHFPGFGVEAARWLVDQRRVTCLGVDTLSLDPGPSQDFAVHVELLGADRYGIEGVANLATIPPRNATVFVGLVPWEEGSGGPCRLLAAW